MVTTQDGNELACLCRTSMIPASSLDEDEEITSPLDEKIIACVWYYAFVLLKRDRFDKMKGKFAQPTEERIGTHERPSNSSMHAWF